MEAPPSFSMHLSGTFLHLPWVCRVWESQEGGWSGIAVTVKALFVPFMPTPAPHASWKHLSFEMLTHACDHHSRHQLCLPMSPINRTATWIPVETQSQRHMGVRWGCCFSRATPPRVSAMARSLHYSPVTAGDTGALRHLQPLR